MNVVKYINGFPNVDPYWHSKGQTLVGYDMMYYSFDVLFSCLNMQIVKGS